METILLPPDTELCGALKEAKDWRLAYDDGVALVFRAVHNDRDNILRDSPSGISPGIS